VVTHTGDVANEKEPLTEATATIAAGANGSATLSDGTRLTYRHSGHTVTIDGKARRDWTLAVTGTDRPRTVRIDGRPTSAWTYAAASRTLTITVPARPARPLTVTF
jgi:hypothetical protein